MRANEQYRDYIDKLVNRKELDLMSQNQHREHDQRM
jgi:hypothetical protein